jgi:hypothetical protein
MPEILFYATPAHEGQSLEIYVMYDPEKKEVTHYSGVYIKTKHAVMNISDLIFICLPELSQGISKIVDRVNWQSIYENSKK